MVSIILLGLIFIFFLFIGLFFSPKMLVDELGNGNKKADTKKDLNDFFPLEKADTLIHKDYRVFEDYKSLINDGFSDADAKRIIYHMYFTVDKWKKLYPNNDTVNPIIDRDLYCFNLRVTLTNDGFSEVQIQQVCNLVDEMYWLLSNEEIIEKQKEKEYITSFKIADTLIGKYGEAAEKYAALISNNYSITDAKRIIYHIYMSAGNCKHYYPDPDTEYPIVDQKHFFYSLELALKDDGFSELQILQIYEMTKDMYNLMY